MRFLRRLRRETPTQVATVPANCLTLNAAPAGYPLVIRELRADAAACLRLREMGFCESARVSKVSAGGNLICQICGVRVALAQRLGELVFVEPVTAEALTA